MIDYIFLFLIFAGIGYIARGIYAIHVFQRRSHIETLESIDKYFKTILVLYQARHILNVVSQDEMPEEERSELEKKIDRKSSQPPFTFIYSSKDKRKFRIKKIEEFLQTLPKGEYATYAEIANETKFWKNGKACNEFILRSIRASEDCDIERHKKYTSFRLKSKNQEQNSTDSLESLDKVSDLMQYADSYENPSHKMLRPINPKRKVGRPRKHQIIRVE